MKEIVVEDTLTLVGSLRDFFAAHAMEALLIHELNTREGRQSDMIAQSAYVMADAMVAARGGK